MTASSSTDNAAAVPGNVTTRGKQKKKFTGYGARKSIIAEEQAKLLEDLRNMTPSQGSWESVQDEDEDEEKRGFTEEEESVIEGEEMEEENDGGSYVSHIVGIKNTIKSVGAKANRTMNKQEEGAIQAHLEEIRDMHIMILEENRKLRKELAKAKSRKVKYETGRELTPNNSQQRSYKDILTGMKDNKEAFKDKPVVYISMENPTGDQRKAKTEQGVQEPHSPSWRSDLMFTVQAKGTQLSDRDRVASSVPKKAGPHQNKDRKNCYERHIPTMDLLAGREETRGKGVKCMQLNAMKSSQNLDHILNNLPDTYDIVLLQEPPIKLKVPGYRSFSNEGDRQRTAILVRSALAGETVLLSTFVRETWCASKRVEILEKVGRIIEELRRDARVVFAWDANAYHNAWGIIEGGGGTEPLARGAEIYDFILAKSLILSNKKTNPLTATYIKLGSMREGARQIRSIIDITTCSQTVQIRGWKVVEGLEDIGDHRPITYTVEKDATSNKPVGIPHMLGNYIYSKTRWRDYEERSEQLLNLSYQQPGNCTTIKDWFGTLHEHVSNSLIDAARDATPQRPKERHREEHSGKGKMRNKSFHPWWDKELKEKRKALNRLRRGNAPEADIRTARTEYRSMMRNKKREGYEKFIEDMQEMDPNDFYRKVKSITNPDKGNTLLEGDTSPEQTAERLADYFLGSDRLPEPPKEERVKIDRSQLYRGSENPQRFRQHFTEEEVAQALASFKPRANKKGGRDGLRWAHYINASQYKLIPLITTLFSLAYRFTICPNEWKESQVAFLSKPNRDATQVKGANRKNEGNGELYQSK
ncbi:hypothetical protein FOL47_001746 [Perkinsus chesapeaki]|uniref:Endonuclease/exonuclease/phosphatase domain-containing protein n=1 Tax=Perkinsus chesapeaki TaxID=330153 RepID=A0A7J6KSE0_PERCH|nr:hypothetical protein FOL47_001746 [Perkinsus chesapeaki]